MLDTQKDFILNAQLFRPRAGCSHSTSVLPCQSFFVQCCIFIHQLCGGEPVKGRSPAQTALHRREH